MSDNVDASVDLHLLVKELHEVKNVHSWSASWTHENEIKEIEQNVKWVKKEIRHG